MPKFWLPHRAGIVWPRKKSTRPRGGKGRVLHVVPKQGVLVDGGRGVELPSGGPSRKSNPAFPSNLNWGGDANIAVHLHHGRHAFFAWL